MKAYGKTEQGRKCQKALKLADESMIKAVESAKKAAFLSWLDGQINMIDCDPQEYNRMEALKDCKMKFNEIFK